MYKKVTNVQLSYILLALVYTSICIIIFNKALLPKQIIFQRISKKILNLFVKEKVYPVNLISRAGMSSNFKNYFPFVWNEYNIKEESFRKWNIYLSGNSAISALLAFVIIYKARHEEHRNKNPRINLSITFSVSTDELYKFTNNTK